MAPSIDREKVVETLQYMISGDCTETQFDYIDEIEAAIAMLKELEPITPSLCGSKEPDWHGSWRYLCGKCKKPIDNKDRFCKRCGQAVKWDA